MPASEGALLGLKILIVEDNYLIAEDVRAIIVRHGGAVVGPAARVRKALDLVQCEARLDGAFLDINLHGEMCFPIATALEARSVHFVFVTGYDIGSIIPPEFAAIPVLAKPIDESGLVTVAASAFQAKRG